MNKRLPDSGLGRQADGILDAALLRLLEIPCPTQCNCNKVNTTPVQMIIGRKSTVITSMKGSCHRG